MATYGYARVSTKDQNVNRQLDALERFPLERSSIYIDYYTGAVLSVLSTSGSCDVSSRGMCRW